MSRPLKRSKGDTFPLLELPLEVIFMIAEWAGPMATYWLASTCAQLRVMWPRDRRIYLMKAGILEGFQNFPPGNAVNKELIRAIYHKLFKNGRFYIVVQNTTHLDIVPSIMWLTRKLIECKVFSTVCVDLIDGEWSRIHDAFVQAVPSWSRHGREIKLDLHEKLSRIKLDPPICRSTIGGGSIIIACVSDADFDWDEYSQQYDKCIICTHKFDE